MRTESGLKSTFVPRINRYRTSLVGKLDSFCEISDEFGETNHSKGLGGLLLGHAMQGAEAEDEVARGYADNFAIGE